MLVPVISWPLVLVVIFLCVAQISLACLSQDLIFGTRTARFLYLVHLHVTSYFMVLISVFRFLQLSVFLCSTVTMFTRHVIAYMPHA